MAESKPGMKLLVVAVIMLAATAAAQKKDFRYTVAPGATVSIINESGAVSVRPSTGRQVIVSANPHSNKVEIDQSQSGNRVELRSHLLQRADPNEAAVDYDVQVPPDTNLIIRGVGGSLRAERLQGDLSLEGDGAQVEVRDVSGGHVRVRTMSGPVTLTNVRNAYVEITSVGGNVTLNNVSGPRVGVNTTTGAIRYEGDFGAGGDYSLSNHSGNIDVTLPASASVDITARSVTGAVENDFPLQPKSHPAFAGDSGKTFSGMANAGQSSVKLRSFSGKIKVKKH
jgi:hypothetical protein